MPPCPDFINILYGILSGLHILGKHFGKFSLIDLCCEHCASLKSLLLIVLKQVYRGWASRGDWLSFVTNGTNSRRNSAFYSFVLIPYKFWWNTLYLIDKRNQVAWIITCVRLKGKKCEGSRVSRRKDGMPEVRGLEGSQVSWAS
jgi:hypothetical protein